jgi:hypothetical protein
MHRIRVIAASLVCTAWLATSALADPVAVGAPITVKKPLKIARLAKRPERFVGKTVRIEGTVNAVCQSTGCWARVVDDKGVEFLAKSLDESVLLRKDSAGRSIVVQGVITRLEPKAHDHEHAEVGHECPQPTFLLSTLGAILK